MSKNPADNKPLPDFSLERHKLILMRLLPLILLTLFLPSFSMAGENQKLLDRFNREVSQKSKSSFLTFAIENDLFGRGTDQHYTNGVRLTWFDFNAGFPGVAYNIADHVPTFEINETSSIYYSLGQNLYTPDEIERRVPEPDDRPWASFLYISMAMSTLTDSHIDDLEATAGIVGPWSLGEQVQKFVHNHISGSPSPKGWSNQLNNEPGVMLSWQRRHPFYYQKNTGNHVASVSPHYGLTAGNVYTYANAGLTFRFSPEQSMWEDLPLRVRPSMAGTGFFYRPEIGPCGWSIFAGLEGRAVGRNIFLDGNSFHDNSGVDKFPFVADVNAGFSFTYKKTRFSYTLVYRTKEFEGQDRGDLFGAFSISRKF
jgi:hypothetical protein